MSNKLSLMVNFVGIDKLSGSLRNITQLGKRGSRSLGELRGEGRKLESQLRDVRRQMEGASGNITEMANRERDLERAIESTNRDLAERKRLNTIEANRRGMVARGDELMGRGRDNMVQGASLAAPLILATKSAAEFSSGMVDIQQKAALTNAQTERLGRNILIMAQNARQLPEDMRAGLDTLLSKGLSLNEAQAAIGPAGRIATAYKVEIPDAANAAYAAINNLKVPAGQTAKILDMMAAAGNEGAFEVRNMARHFPALTAQMQALGEKGAPAVADLAAALQVAMNAAGSEDQAANNIQNLLAKINAPGTIAAFKKNFGVDLPAAMAKLTAEGYSSLEAIALITDKATGGDTKKLGFAFEDQQARMGILALIKDLDEYRRVRAAAMNSGGTVDQAFAQRATRDATVNWRAFLASASALAITLGTTLLPVATQAMDIVSGIGNGITAWAQANPEAAATLTKLVAGLAVFKIGLGAAQFAIGGFMKPLASVNALVLRFAGSWGNAFAMMRTAALMLGSGLMKAGAMMLANPIILVIAAIVLAIAGAAYLIYTHWDTIKAAFMAGWAYVKNLLASAPDWLKNIGKMMMNGLLMAINPLALGVRLIAMAKNGIAAFKNYLGIKSPSRVFMGLGEHTAAGMALGLQRGERNVLGAAGRMATGMVAASSLATAPALAAQGQAGQGGAAPITINIYQQPGEDMTELARRVGEELQRAQTGAMRRSYEDGN